MPRARLHAIQCRINAEDPEKNFQPSPGRIEFYYAPGGRGVRIDSHAYTGYVVPPYYDSMIAKLITVGATRASAIARMRRALDEYYITGIKTTVPFHSAIMRNADFRNGTYDTGFVERVMNSDNFELNRRRRGCTNNRCLDRRGSQSLPALRHSRSGLCRELGGGKRRRTDDRRGVDLIQLRAKEHARPRRSRRSPRTLHRHHIASAAFRSIINDHPEIARIVPAEGVHVGQDDLPIAEAREIAGPNCMVGKSTHSVDQAIRAFYEGADYIGFGPIFATPTKPDYPPIGLEEIRKVHDAVRIPIFCIGGIKLDNLPEVIEAGARRVVIVSGLLQAKDIATYGRAAKELLNRKSKF